MKKELFQATPFSYSFPEEPNPPDPLSESDNSSTISKLITGLSSRVNCAMRSSEY